MVSLAISLPNSLARYAVLVALVAGGLLVVAHMLVPVVATAAHTLMLAVATVALGCVNSSSMTTSIVFASLH